jgi:flagellar biosynthesis protein
MTMTGKDKMKKAVALRYEPNRQKAPHVIAKGRGLAAERIIELARTEGIPIQEEPELIEALIQLDFYEEIPPALYRAVAEILAFVYRMNQHVRSRAIFS